MPLHVFYFIPLCFYSRVFGFGVCHMKFYVLDFLFQNVQKLFLFKKNLFLFSPFWASISIFKMFSSFSFTVFLIFPKFLFIISLSSLFKLDSFCLSCEWICFKAEISFKLWEFQILLSKKFQLLLFIFFVINFIIRNECLDIV